MAEPLSEQTIEHYDPPRSNPSWLGIKSQDPDFGPTGAPPYLRRLVGSDAYGGYNLVLSLWRPEEAHSYPFRGKTSGITLNVESAKALRDKLDAFIAKEEAAHG
jgi:hypothetical protein